MAHYMNIAYVSSLERSGKNSFIVRNNITSPIIESQFNLVDDFIIIEKVWYNARIARYPQKWS